MAEKPWIRFFAGDFLTGVADLEPDEGWGYTMCLALMWDKGGPIEDDPRWIARRANLSTRRWNQIRAKLLNIGKLEFRDGLLGNRKAIREIERRDRVAANNRNAALRRWYGHNEPELPLNGVYSDEEPQFSANHDDANASEGAGAAGQALETGDEGEISPNKSTKTARTNGLKEGDNSEETAENRHSGDATASDSRARAKNPEPESRLQSTDSVHCPPGEPDDRSLARSGGVLDDLWGEVSKAAGYDPPEPERIAAGKAQIERWLQDGIDPERTILPTIRRMISKSDDPTSSLKRFDRHIRLAHAKGGGTSPTPVAPLAPPDTPEEDDPDPRLAQIRSDLRRDVGARTYDGWLKPCVLTVDPEKRLTVTLPSHFMADWVLTHFGERFRLEAGKHGFTAVLILCRPPPRKASK